MSEPGRGATAEPQVRLPLAVLAVVGAVVLALLAVGLVTRLDAERLPAVAPRDPPAPAPPATRMTVAERKVSFEEFSMTLAGAPYRCGEASQPPAGFTQVALCTTTVHDDYDGKGSDWMAVSGVGLVDSSRVVPGDLPGTATAVFDGLLASLYVPEDRPSLAKVSTDPAAVGVPEGAAATRQADVDVTIAGLPTPYDRLVTIVVRLADGQHVAFFSAFPHDGSKAALQALVDSVGTLEARP